MSCNKKDEENKRVMPEKIDIQQKKQKSEQIEHPFPPLYDKQSRILILGSFPSVKSREQQFFYGHPQNRFWKTLAGVLSEEVPQTIEEKKEFLYKNHIAVWDVIHRCEIIGSSDSSIRDVVPNDLSIITDTADIRAIYCNGAKSYQYYVKYLEEKTGIQAKKLPSTSPANAGCNLERLKESWKIICGPLKAAPAGIGETLLNWYDYNARILPWRSEPTPYHVWISEIMLQQTRVEAVKKYYDRWMEALPDVDALAKVDDEKLMKLWEGLGYYNRVRNIKTAAVTLTEKYDGNLPNDYDKLLSLKGVGEYTAGAIASIAFGLPKPAVDGNVLRVFSRLLAEEGDIGKQSVRKQITMEVSRILPKERPGDFNQALMDLGSGICLPKGQPLCEKCPWEAVCQAHREGTEQEFPVKASKKSRKIEEKTVFVIEIYREINRKQEEINKKTEDKDTEQENSSREKWIVLRKRPSTGLLPDLWEFPNEEGCYSVEKAEEAMEKWMEESGIKNILGETMEKGEPLGKAAHIFSHVEWHMIGYRFRLNVPTEEKIESLASYIEKQDSLWALVPREEMDEHFAMPSAFAYYKKQI